MDVKLRFVDVGAIVDEFLFNLTEPSLSPCLFFLFMDIGLET